MPAKLAWVMLSNSGSWFDWLSATGARFGLRVPAGGILQSGTFLWENEQHSSKASQAR
jgi:hypothetical protein